MSNLLASIGEAASALDLFQRALTTVQNNVTNTSTPGYVRQRQMLEAAPFDPANGLIGGVRDGGIESARSEYAEQSVRAQAGTQGKYEAMAASLARIESVFDVSGKGGIPGALSKLFQSFSAWSVTPNDATARQTVLEQAGQVARAFQQTASELVSARSGLDSDIATVTGRINDIGKQILEINQEVRNGQSNPALEAKLYSSLEELSQYVDFTVLREKDGTATVLLGGQIPLVMGDADRSATLTVEAATGLDTQPPPELHIMSGSDRLDTLLSQGKLAGLLEVRNQVIPSLLGRSAADPGDLNRLATEFAGRVNELLTGGAPPDPDDQSLFTLGTNPCATAANMKVNPLVTSATLTPGTAAASNGIALALAGLTSPSDPADRMDGVSFTQFYARIASGIGTKSANAKDQQSLYTQLTAQARNLRQQMSGVSLDEEAAVLIQFQRSYQAAARMISVLNELTEVAVNLGRS